MISKQANLAENRGKLQTFLENYGQFLGQCSDQPHDLQSLIRDFTDSIPPPPEHAADNQQIQQLYHRSKTLTKQSASELVSKLRSLKEDKLQDLITHVEQLSVTLNAEYEREINRATELGIYARVQQN